MSQNMSQDYEIANLDLLLKDNSYPGRGIIIGESADAKSMAVAYFIMGRSDNSRNRVFVEEGNGVRIYPADESKVSDPSLIIYSPLIVERGCLVVTNGDQTDTICECLSKGFNTGDECGKENEYKNSYRFLFQEALLSRSFEPDKPNYTPRISGIMRLSDSFSYQLSILKSQDADGRGCERYFYDYEPYPGLGHFIHTYKCDGNPLPSFSGEPERVSIPNSADELKDIIWESLDKDNRISLYVRYINRETGQMRSILKNRYNKK